MIIRSNFPRVVKYQKRGKAYWYVDTRSKELGTTGRKNFNSEQAAVDYAKDFREKLKLGQVVEDGVIKDQQLEKWRERLKVYGKDINDACQHYLHHLGEQQKRTVIPPVKELCERWEKEKLNDTLDPKRPKTKTEIKSYARWIRRTFGETRVFEITEGQCRKVLNEMDRGNITKRQYLAYLHMFLKWSFASGYIQQIPTSKIEVHVKDPRARFYSAEQVQNMMELANTKYPELIPYLSLCVFAGLRPSEAESATWKDVDFATKEIFVAGLKAEQDRRIILHDTCLAWLKFAKDATLEIRPPNLLRKLKSFRAELGIEWVQDVLRHTFATHWKAAGHTLDELRDYLGHMTSKMTRKHYLRSIAKDEATEFWSILPATDSAKT